MALCPNGNEKCRQVGVGICMICATNIDWKDGAGDNSRCCFFCCSETAQVKEITINGNQEDICDVCSKLEQFQPFMEKKDDVPDEILCFVCDSNADAYQEFNDGTKPTCTKCRFNFFPDLPFNEIVREV